MTTIYNTNINILIEHQGRSISGKNLVSRLHEPVSINSFLNFHDYFFFQCAKLTFYPSKLIYLQPIYLSLCPNFTLYSQIEIQYDLSIKPAPLKQQCLERGRLTSPQLCSRQIKQVGSLKLWQIRFPVALLEVTSPSVGVMDFNYYFTYSRGIISWAALG